MPAWSMNRAVPQSNDSGECLLDRIACPAKSGCFLSGAAWWWPGRLKCASWPVGWPCFGPEGPTAATGRCLSNGDHVLLPVARTRTNRYPPPRCAVPGAMAASVGPRAPFHSTMDSAGTAALGCFIPATSKTTISLESSTLGYRTCPRPDSKAILQTFMPSEQPPIPIPHPVAN